MAVTETTNYALKKHDEGDLGYATDLNTNFDVIDTAMKANADAIATKASKATDVSGTLTMVTSVQFDSVNSKYQVKTRDITVTDGVITAIGAESAWADVPTV